MHRNSATQPPAFLGSVSAPATTTSFLTSPSLASPAWGVQPQSASASQQQAQSQPQKSCPPSPSFSAAFSSHAHPHSECHSPPRSPHSMPTPNEHRHSVPHTSRGQEARVSPQKGRASLPHSTAGKRRDHSTRRSNTVMVGASLSRAKSLGYGNQYGATRRSVCGRCVVHGCVLPRDPATRGYCIEHAKVGERKERERG